jgi:hypothetical protein
MHSLGWSELVKEKKIDEDPDYEGPDLKEDQPSCVKKLFFIETNHICTELSQNTESQRILSPALKERNRKFHDLET